MYGYGPELSSALKKMDRGKHGFLVPQAIQYIPIVGHMFNILSIAKQLVEEPFSSHPTSISRAKSQLKYLEYELNNNNQLDSKMKKEIEKQIFECKTILDEYIDSKHEIKIYNPLIMNVLYDRIKLYLLDGDIKTLMFSDEENFKSYIRMQDYQLKNNKG